MKPVIFQPCAGQLGQWTAIGHK